MKRYYITLSESAMETIKNRQEVCHTLTLEDVEVHIRSYESFLDDRAREDWVKDGKYIYNYPLQEAKKAKRRPWDKIIHW